MSYRQVGKLPTGRIRSSKVAGQHNGQRAFSSIPSKFETTLFTGNRERDGFGSSAHRFSEVENELPGPGSYNADSAAAALVDTMVFSKKGYGSGFVSKTKRQSAFAKAAASTPAPTAYGYGSAGTFDAAARANRFGASTSAFQPETKRSVTVADEPAPGPGAYSHVRSFDRGSAELLASHGGLHSAAALAAKLQSGAPAGARVKQATGSDPRALGKPRVAGKTWGESAAPSGAALASKNQPTPAPGAYDPRPDRLGAQAAHFDQLLPTSAFRDRTAGSGGIFHDNPAAASRRTAEQRLGVVAPTDAARGAPGPGAYNSATTSFYATYRRSPQFCDSLIDRFGRALPGASRKPRGADVLPGPGQYHYEPPRESALISSSAFMSATVRDNLNAAPGAGVPGPAFYKPSNPLLEPKRSFHLNAVERFMP